jgi:hypothetical protein
MKYDDEGAGCHKTRLFYNIRLEKVNGCTSLAGQSLIADRGKIDASARLNKPAVRLVIDMNCGWVGA